MGNITPEYINSLEMAVAEAREYLSGVNTVAEFSYNPTEIVSKVSGYASSLTASL